jgi:hypothetical protein
MENAMNEQPVYWVEARPKIAGPDELQAMLRMWSLGLDVCEQPRPFALADRLEALRLLRKTPYPDAPTDNEVLTTFGVQVGAWMQAFDAAPERPGEGGLYAITFGDGDAVKLGVSNDVPRRRAGLQTGSPFELRTLFVVPGLGLEDEALVHEAFAAHRVLNEWFRAEGPVAEWLAQMRERCRG